MVVVGDIQRQSKITNRGEHFVSKGRMVFHHNPLIIRQRTGFKKNAIWNTHLADVVKENSPADLHKVNFTHTQRAG